jgi:hypothetical protein
MSSFLLPSWFNPAFGILNKMDTDISCSFSPLLLDILHLIFGFYTSTDHFLTKIRKFFTQGKVRASMFFETYLFRFWLKHKPIMTITTYIPECLSSELGPPLGSWGEPHSLAGEGWKDPIQTTGQTLWYSTIYINIPLRISLIKSK